MPGPVPKREDQRRRRNKPAVPTTRAPGAALVEQPAPGEDWHHAARAWYVSLAQSGQARFYEPSDWQVAWIWAEAVSQTLASGRPSAELIKGWQQAQTDLLATEGSRRRARLELDRPDTQQAPARKSSTRDRLRAV